MIKSALVSAAAIVALISPPLAFAQSTYTISVTPDESTAGDMGVLGSAISTAAEGEASQSIRKLAAGVMGELRILMDQRVSNEVLTLDDGTSVALLEGDTITLKERCDPSQKECSQTPGAQILWNKSGHGPYSIFIFTGNGCLRVIEFGKSNGKPLIFTKCP